MKSTWFDVADIVPVSENNFGWSVRVHNREGIVYEERHSWSLMLQLTPSTLVNEEKWLAIACLLLSSYGELGCGLCTFQNRWWLASSYDHPVNEDKDAVAASEALSLQVSLAGFIEQWPMMLRNKNSSPVNTNNPVGNKWA